MVPFLRESYLFLLPAVAERLRLAYTAPLGRDGVGSIPANPDAQHVPSFRRWRFEMKLSPFFFFSIALYRFFGRAQKETAKYANPAKLAMCTWGPRKVGFGKQTFSIGLLVLAWMSSMLIFRLFSDPGCVYKANDAPSLNFGCCACKVVSWGFVMLLFSGIFDGLLIKYFVIASYHDYTIQSQRMELKAAEEEA
jgi:hypothetical protein